MIDKPSQNVSTSRSTGALFGWGLGFFLLLLPLMCANDPSPRSRTRNAHQALPTEISSTMTEAEKLNFAADPSSAGFSEADRRFLREQGVSEQEARAMETILRQNGIN
jgi:hypothetical protein